MDVKKTSGLKVKKGYNSELYDLELKQGQKVSFISKEGHILGQLEYRDGELYLMKHSSLKGHNMDTGEHFGFITRGG